MLGEIATKARDAASMFVQSLTDEERRGLVILGLYVASTVWALYRDAAKLREREQLIADVKRELAGA